MTNSLGGEHARRALSLRELVGGPNVYADLTLSIALSNSLLSQIKPFRSALRGSRRAISVYNVLRGFISGAVNFRRERVEREDCRGDTKKLNQQAAPRLLKIPECSSPGDSGKEDIE